MLFKWLLNSEVPEYDKKAEVFRDNKDTFRWKIKSKLFLCLELFGAYNRPLTKFHLLTLPFFLTV